MPRTCSLCKRPDRDAIDQAIRDNVPFRSIAAQFCTSHTTIRRHAQHVLKETAAAAPAIQRVGEISAKNFLEDLLRMKERAEKWFLVAEKEKNVQAAILMMREVRATIDTMVKLALLQRQLDAELADKQQREYKDVTPAVQQLIDHLFEEPEETEE